MTLLGQLDMSAHVVISGKNYITVRTAPLDIQMLGEVSLQAADLESL